jgi:broad specificity phosphatase PhoE
MTKKEYAECMKEMKQAGAAMQEERGGEFNFGEWAGESEDEILLAETGHFPDEFTDDERDELLDAYLGY